MIPVAIGFALLVVGILLGDGGYVEFAGYVYETELADCAEWDDYDAEIDIDELQENLAEIGCDWHDVHAGNMGYIDGRAVLIDCGDELFGDGSVVTRGRRLENQFT